MHRTNELINKGFSPSLVVEIIKLEKGISELEEIRRLSAASFSEAFKRLTVLEKIVTEIAKRALPNEEALKVLNG